MDKNNLIELTKKLYRLTLFLPKKEPIRYKMRELADEILATFLRITNSYEYTNTNNQSKKREARPLSVLEDLEVLDSFFEVAKAQNWVSPSALLAIQQEYSKIKEGLNDIDREEPAFAPPSPLRRHSFGASATRLRWAGKATAGKKEAADIEIEEKAAEHEAVPQHSFFQDQEKINPVRDNPAPSAKGRDDPAPLARRISNGVNLVRNNPVHQEAIPVEAGRASNPVRNQRFLNRANGVNERQRKILEILKEREKIQVREMGEVFPQVTKRTLRRDFEQLFKRGLIERIGEKNDTYYQLMPAISEDR